jgi:hypothetical protein
MTDACGGVMHSRACADSNIGDAGANKVAEALKANTTLTELYLNSALRSGLAVSLAAAHARTAAHGVFRWLAYFRTLHDGRMWRRVHSRACAANSIGEAGAKEVAEALKANMTLTTLDLGGALRSGVAASLAAAHAHAKSRVWRVSLARVLPHVA